MLQTISIVCDALIALLGAMFAYRGIYTVLGLFRTKQFPKAQTLHRYGVLIAARNEEAVIGNLIDSIHGQNYPRHLVEVFVVADNCTDNTAQIARDHGAVCYERFNTLRQTKGFALDFLLKNIQKDYGIQSFDGYFIFDADNLLKRDFIRAMNDAFDSGEKIITSYRNTKNFDANFISANYALHWMRTARMESMARSWLGISTRLQGCGYLVASELVKNGWPHTSLTEDRAFSMDAVSRGIHISYQDEAEFYDEQPVTFPIVWRQRMRWSKGNLLAFGELGGQLLRSVIHGKTLKQRLSCLDMFLVSAPYALIMIPLKLIKCAILVLGVAAGGTLWSGVLTLAVGIFQILILEHFGVIPMGLALFFTEHRRLPKIPLYKMLWYSLTFPFFSIIGDLTLLVCVFQKVTWEPIPHKASIRIGEIERRMQEKNTVSAGK